MVPQRRVPHRSGLCRILIALTLAAVLGLPIAWRAAAAGDPQTGVPSEVEQAVRSDLARWVGVLASDPHSRAHGVEDPARYSLGDGYRLYRVSRFVREGGVATTLDQFTEAQDVYRFVVNLDGRPLGIAEVQRQGGRWAVVGVGYDGPVETAGNGGTATGGFADRLARARALLAERGLLADVRWVDHPPYLTGLAGSDGEDSSFISLGNHLGLAEGHVTSLADVSARIHQAAGTDANGTDAKSPPTTPDPLATALAGVGVLGAAVGVGGYLWLRRASG
ncbi:hypothetical protein [Thermaerobacter subterraneus]|uniref:Uncharacterized protein n=1 Tax=Thermaerobacter subterraneus DSM 13965 TaxID=867903 RepID=K6Q2D6_9FIRM|nr:hypothetical protein [Thermaerobacter subterraneus]EKP95368.1 hypothetical protein ThesuDRAFT_01118 [Thermaerobacter subterraneus DSM 13965]